MSNVITEWRLAITAQLEANLQGGAYKGNVIPGDLKGPSRDRNLACIYAPPMLTDGAQVDMARPVLIVRAWIRMPKTPKRTTPPDPEPVEQLMVDLAACLQQAQVLPSVGPNGLFSVVTGVEPDYELFQVTATLRGWTENPAVLAEAAPA